MPLENGAALRLTTALYFTPNGRSIQVTGVTPDITLENLTPTQIAAREQREIREENLRGHFGKKGQPGPAPAVKENSPGDGTDGKEEPAEKENTVKEGELGKDPQLDRALQLLKSWRVFKTTVATAGK